MFTRIRNFMLVIFLLVLAGCYCEPKSEWDSGECPFDHCASTCPRPKDCWPTGTGAQMSRIEKKCGGWGAYSPVFELQQKGVQVIEIGENAIIILPVDQFFEVNCATIREDAYDALNYLICLLNRYGYVPLYISAHTDNVASTSFNGRLSDDRAHSIQAYLWMRGIHFRRMCATGCGNFAPIANQVMVAGNAVNRRIEIRVRKTGYCA